MLNRLLLLLLLFIGLNGPLWALETAVPESTSTTIDELLLVDPRGEDELEPELSLPGIESLGVMHRYLALKVETSSRDIDGFFGDERVYETASGTYIQLRASLLYSRFDKTEFNGRVRAKLDLPNLDGKVQLLLDNDQDQDNPFEDRITTGTENPGDVFQENDLATSLQFILQEKERWSVRLQPGIKFKWPLDYFVKLQLLRKQPIGEVWFNRSRLNIDWYSARGWELPLRIDFERSWNKENLFRLTTEVVWRQEEEENLFWLQEVQLTEKLSRRSQISYAAGITGERLPNWVMTSYYGNARLRKNIHQGWLFLELKPQLQFRRTYNFKAEPSIVLTLEMLVGGHYW